MLDQFDERGLCKHTRRSYPNGLIDIHIFDCPDSRLSELFTLVPPSPDNRGSTVARKTKKTVVKVKPVLS